MAVRHGYGKIAGTDALVFAYDTGDVRNSYKGEPTTNLISSTGIDMSALSTYHLLIRSRVTDSASPSGYACEMEIQDGATINSASRIRFGNATNIPTSGNVFVSVYAKFQGGPTSNIVPWIFSGVNWYDMSPLDGGSIYLTSEYRRFGRYVQVGTASGGPNPGFSMTQNNSNRQTGQKTRWHSPQVEVKSHATPFVAGTRSATQGLLDLNGSSTPDLTNISFDSNAQPTWDGTNDTISIPSNSSNNIAGDITMELVLNRTAGYGAAVMHKEIQYTLYVYSNGSITYADSSIWSYASFGAYGNLTAGTYHHLVATKTEGVVNIYLDGTVIITRSFGSAITQTSSTLYIGSYDGSSNFFAGQIPVAKVYNRALTADEVRNNYRHYKTRFDI